MDSAKKTAHDKLLQTLTTDLDNGMEFLKSKQYTETLQREEDVVNAVIK
jgi:hypothetical protein